MEKEAEIIAQAGKLGAVTIATNMAGQDIGLGMVAEGVETKEQAEFLSNCGCDIAQGFYYAKPMCVADFKQLQLGKAR